MSRDAMIQFFARLGQEPELQDQLVEFAAKHGFEFTADELTDSDLEKLAGGPTRRVDAPLAGLTDLPDLKKLTKLP